MAQADAAMEQSSCIMLSNGVQLPRIGLGTFKAAGDNVRTAVKAAVQAGITHIDTAAIYKVRLCCISHTTSQTAWAPSQHKHSTPHRTQSVGNTSITITVMYLQQGVR